MNIKTLIVVLSEVIINKIKQLNRKKIVTYRNGSMYYAAHIFTS